MEEEASVSVQEAYKRFRTCEQGFNTKRLSVNFTGFQDKTETYTIERN